MFKRIHFGYAGDQDGRDAAVLAEQVGRLCASKLSVVAAELPAGEDRELDVRRGDPWRLLLEARERLDLLVLGSRAYGSIRHPPLGGVSAAVMRGAHCPVLVLPRGEGVAGVAGSAGARPSEGVETPPPATVSPSQAQFFAAAKRAVYPLGQPADWA
jgi:hypothetical protein